MAMVKVPIEQWFSKTCILSAFPLPGPKEKRAAGFAGAPRRCCSTALHHSEGLRQPGHDGQ